MSLDTGAPALIPLEQVCDPSYALTDGYRCLKLDKQKNLQDLAQQASVDPRYVNRMLNLTTLAPDIVADILDGKLPDITISTLTTNTPRLWVE